MKSVPVEKWDLKSKFLKELDFLSDHWVNGDDKPPFSFGGWREEVANKFVEIASQALQAAKEEERKKIADSIDSFPLQDSMFFDENNWEAGYKALGEFKQSIINKHQ